MWNLYVRIFTHKKKQNEIYGQLLLLLQLQYQNQHTKKRKQTTLRFYDTKHVQTNILDVASALQFPLLRHK